MRKLKFFSLQFFMVSVMACLFCACDDDVVFQQSKSFADGAWPKDSAVVFAFDSQDMNGTYDIIVDLRNTDDYQFQNFWLFANMSSPDGKVYRDTLECVLADNNGRWIGEGVGSIHHLPVSLLSDIKFPRNGRYRFELIQGMRMDNLKGISDIGIRIKKKSTK